MDRAPPSPDCPAADVTRLAACYRRDPLAGRWVIIAEGRAGRPQEFVAPAQRPANLRCPFCAGHETDTPPALATYGAHRDVPWQVRVVPNAFPAVALDQTWNPQPAQLGLVSPAVGAHEVIIESPDHRVSLVQLTRGEAARVFEAYRDRLRLHATNPGLTYGLVFKNVGVEAGASLEHAHSQLLALPVVPDGAAQRLAASQRWRQERGECYFCRWIADECLDTARLVAESDAFVAVCPFASVQPYEMCVLPRQHASHFEEIPPDQVAELGGLVRQLLRQLDRCRRRVAYNYLIHSAPFRAGPLDHYHWHIAILPRVTQLAGFEWATGCFINPVSPERAARELRAAALGSAMDSGWKN